LLSGPVAQPELLSIVPKFSRYLMGLAADISKMYRRVSMHEENRSLQKLLWRRSSEEPIKEYELSTVTYGTAPAAFLATRYLQQLALDERERFPKASDVLRSSFYVDYFLRGCSTPEEAIDLR
jgi:hypothetical protein